LLGGSPPRRRRGQIFSDRRSRKPTVASAQKDHSQNVGRGRRAGGRRHRAGRAISLRPDTPPPHYAHDPVDFPNRNAREVSDRRCRAPATPDRPEKKKKGAAPALFDFDRITGPIVRQRRDGRKDFFFSVEFGRNSAPATAGTRADSGSGTVRRSNATGRLKSGFLTGKNRQGYTAARAATSRNG